MATITFDDENVFTIGTGYTTSKAGAGAFRRPVAAKTGRPLKLVTGTFTFDATQGSGEDISEIFKQFTQTGASSYGLLGMIVDESGALGAAKTGKHAVVDYANKLLVLYDNAATPAAAGTDQNNVAVRFLAWGF